MQIAAANSLVSGEAWKPLPRGTLDTEGPKIKVGTFVFSNKF
jgi:hypothetical protein